MRRKAGIIGLVLLGWAVTAHAQSSPYSSMAVAGGSFTNSWSETPNMTLVADRTWQCVQEVTTANGEFKFVANGDWGISWGGGASLYRIPASASAPDPGGGNLNFADLTPGLYQFTFNDETLAFQIEWAGGSPLPPPSFSSLSLVGTFNNWNAGSTQLTNHPVDTNLWSRSVELYSGTAFQFFPDGTWSNQFGAPEAAAFSVTNLNSPVTNNACGKSDYTLSISTPGTFRFELNTSNNLFTVMQTATQQPLSGMTVQGSIAATENPTVNMMQIGDTLWQSDHYLTNNGTVTLRFSADGGAQIWGATNTTPVPFPASAILSTGLTAFAQVSGVVPGRYRITFDHQTGVYNFQQVYAESSGINLLENPGFEETSNGYAVNWGSWQSWPKSVADEFIPHSGNWCGAIHAKWYSDWTDYASFAQDVLVTEGRTYRAAAWFKATPDWTASVMQIKIEWLNAMSESLGGDIIENIPSLSSAWVQYAAEGIAPEGAATAHVVFLCSGAGTTGTMHIDDAEMRAMSGRTQNFDTWGALTNFAAFAPDWSVTSGRTVWNVPPGRPPAAVMISQYVEGTGNNKAVEIFNGTLSPLNLSTDGYYLQQFNNGSLTPSVSIPLTGTLAAGTCLVVGRQDTPTNYAPDAAISDLGNLMTNKYITFNGDDVIVLRKFGPAGPPTSILDRVGEVGTNATGSIWSRNTTDRTLTRKSTIFTGTVGDVTADFPLLDEWIVSSNNTFTDLGTHEISFLDPNEPYTPGGYSLIMDSGATLMSGELSGGIGDISFWFRTESMTPPVTLAIETAGSDAGPWSNVVTLTDVAVSNFAYYVVAANRGNHTRVRFRQTDGGTNRFRIDEITVSEASAVKRLEDFSGWTDPAYEVPGTYSRSSWTIQDGSISTTTGVYDSRAALISPPSGAVLSPAYELGVGEVIFWTKAEDPAFPATLLLQTSIDGGTNWFTQGTFLSSTGNTYSTWLYLTNNPTQMRLVFDPAEDSGNALLDNIEVRIPALYRNQNFNGWPYKSSYSSGTAFFQGWSINNCIVDAQYAYSGMAARLNQSTSGDAWIESPSFPDGVGSISYRMRKTSPSATSPSVQVQVSPNGVGWTTIATHTATTTNFTLFNLFREDTTNHFVRFVHSAGASAVPVDDIQIGIPQPRPEISIDPNSDPSAPSATDTVQLTADIVTRYGANVLSVTGVYKIASGGWTSVPMTQVAYGSYASVTPVPAVPASVTVQYYIKVQYTGIGAAPASTDLSTNLVNSVTNSYRISSVKQGDVWINELSYLVYDEDWEEDHEFVELCGKAGANVSGWTIQLAFGSDADIAANSNQPVYASYTIPSHSFTNQTNGFSFYVLGDQQLLDGGDPIDLVLDTYVPIPWADVDHNHMHNSRGVIRLLNEYSNLVYSLSYAGSASGSDRIPTSQNANDTNAVSLTGTGSTFEDFTTWERTNYTVGAINEGQTLDEGGGGTLAVVWHVPTLLVTPVNTNVPPFYMRDPINAQSKSNLVIHYGYPDSLYTLPSGTLYHRETGGSWSTESMAFLTGSRDANLDSYVRGTIPLRTYDRGTSIEYVLEANAGAGTDATFIGLGTTNDYELFDTLGEAQASPFTYTYQILSEIFITHISTNTTSWIFQTEGNDVLEPFVNFRVYYSTNLHLGTHLWGTNSYTVTPIDVYGSNTFTVPKAPADPVKTFYRIDPLWP